MRKLFVNSALSYIDQFIIKSFYVKMNIVTNIHKNKMIAFSQFISSLKFEFEFYNVIYKNINANE